jgi:hypothetical protein
MYDEYAAKIIADNKNMLVPWYLMASYAYYVLDDPILSDAMYDSMSKQLLANFDNISHYHKPLLSKDMLEAGSYLGEYPSIILGAVRAIDPNKEVVAPVTGKDLFEW